MVGSAHPTLGLLNEHYGKSFLNYLMGFGGVGLGQGVGATYEKAPGPLSQNQSFLPTHSFTPRKVRRCSSQGPQQRKASRCSAVA